MEEYKFEYQHRSLKDAVFALACLAYPYVKDTSIVDNLKADCDKEAELYEDLKKRYAKALEILEIIEKKVMPLVSIIDDMPEGTFRVYDGEMYLHRDLTKEEFNLIKELLER